MGFLKSPAFNSFTLDGGVEVFPSELFDGAEKTDCYVSPEDYKALTENPFVLGEAPVPLFYGAARQDVNTGGWLCQLGTGRGIYDLPPLWETYEISGPDSVGYGV